MRFDAKKMSAAIAFFLLAAAGFGQIKNPFRFEFGPRLLAFHQNPANQLPVDQRKDLLGTRYGLGFRAGIVACRNRKNGTAWEAGLLGTIGFAKARIDRSRLAGGVGPARLGIYFFEAPLRFKFPILTNMRALTKTSESEPRFLTASIGLQFSRAYPTEGVMRTKCRGGECIRYWFYNHHEKDFGCYSIEFGLAKTFDFNKKWQLVAAARSTIGIVPMVGYELGFSGKNTGSSNVLGKNDAFTIDLRFQKRKR